MADVLEYMAGGMTTEEILEEFPDLTRDDILAVLAFAAFRERRIFSPHSQPGASMRSMEGITIDPEIMGGTPVFTGTRVPVESLIQHLSAGDTLDDFLEGFPGVTREQATGFLRMAFYAAIESIGR